MRLALAQINPTVGDLAGNRALILDRLETAKNAGADVVVFPELVVTGYPPEDLLLRPGFVRSAEESLRQIAGAVRGIVAIVGAPYADGERLYNVAAVCADGEVKERVRKQLLPNYGVFDEVRYFTPGTDAAPIEIAATRVGVTVCEDMWQPGPPASELTRLGARLLINISASPFHIGKDRAREEMFRRARAQQRSVRRVLQRRGRPGRAALRRALVRDRRTRRGDRACTRVRGGAARGRSRRAGADRPVRGRARADATSARARTAATTCARTASPRCSSASPAESTPL